jgi:Tfp pilus assembly protein PilW
LLEFLASVAVMTLIATAAIACLTYSQKSYSSTQARANMHAGIRSAAELMTQEIGQAGAAVNGSGVYPQGILSSSSATTLTLFGDINGDGTLVQVQYVCDASTSHTLTRSVTPYSPSASVNPGVVLVDNVYPNPGGTACFQYATSVSAASYTFIPGVAFTITVQTPYKDLQTGVYIQMTKSFLNLSPRNILAGIDMANTTGMSSRLLATPTGLPLH